jgi:hypothetical protein
VIYCYPKERPYIALFSKQIINGTKYFDKGKKGNEECKYCIPRAGQTYVNQMKDNIMNIGGKVPLSWPPQRPP